MDLANSVLLEHLPPTFSESMLRSILAHVPCKGDVLSTRVNAPAQGGGGGKPTAQVNFEKAEDAESAVKVWDQLIIQGTMITAWTANNPGGGGNKKKAAPPVGTEGKSIAQGGQTPLAAQQATGQQMRPIPGAPQQQHRNPGDPLPGVLAGAGTTKTYPYGNMNLTWLVGIVSGLANPHRGYGMCMIHECLMTAALYNNDQVMEHAVMHFYTRFSQQAWCRAATLYSDNGVAFELARQVFEVLGLVKKFPAANAKSKKLLLSLVDRVVEDVTKVSAQSKTLSMNKAIPEVISSVRTSLTTLKNLNVITPPPPTVTLGEEATPEEVATAAAAAAAKAKDAANSAKDHSADLDAAHRGLVSWLKFLFSCLSSNHQQVPTVADSTILEPCSERCRCPKTHQKDAKGRPQRPVAIPAPSEDPMSSSTGASSSATLGRPSQTNYYHGIEFGSAAEACKIIDMILIASGTKERDGEANLLTRSLLSHFCPSYCKRVAKHLHNGEFFEMRLEVYSALCVDSGHWVDIEKDWYDWLEATLIHLRYQVKHCRVVLQSVLALMDNALVCLYDLRGAEGRNELQCCAQQFYALQFDLTQVFHALCDPKFHLCVHDVKARARTVNRFAAGGATATATKDGGSLAAGQQQQPIIPQEIHQCANSGCVTEEPDLKKCSGCKLVLYCSRDCQKADWGQHKTACKAAAAKAKELEEQQLATAAAAREVEAAMATPTSPIPADEGSKLDLGVSEAAGAAVASKQQWESPAPLGPKRYRRLVGDVDNKSRLAFDGVFV